MEWKFCLLAALCSPAVVCVEEDGDHEVTLLQISLALHHDEVKSVIQAPNSSNHSAESDFLPVAWVHVPKCGSTFENSILRIPGACPEVNLDILTRTDSKVAVHELTMEKRTAIIQKFCTGIADMSPPKTIGHAGIASTWDSVYKGHALIMLRQPEQRIISGYYDHFHSWPYWYYGRWPKSMKEYAEVVSGCAVKMLTRDSGNVVGKGHFDPWAPCGSPDPVTSDEAQLALVRLRSGFVFVGITDHWDMSVCLLHLMLGGQCHASEFTVVHPGSMSSPEPYDTSELDGFVDIYDGSLFEEAQHIYENNLKKYGASSSSCDPCFKQAALSMGAGGL